MFASSEVTQLASCTVKFIVDVPDKISPPFGKRTLAVGAARVRGNSRESSKNAIIVFFIIF